MATTEQKIQCPSCGESISIDDVLTRQIEEKIKKNLEAAQKIKEQELAHKFEELKKQAADIAEKNKNIESVIAEQVTDKLNAERIKIFKDARSEAEKEQNAKTVLLEEQLKSKNENYNKRQKMRLNFAKKK